MKPSPAISVVVPTFRRPALLRRCLEALIVQNFSRDYEILVADDGADTATANAVAAIAGRVAGSPRTRYLAVRGTHGPAAARNVGWRAADADIIAFTDDDCIPDRDWLRAGLARFSATVVSVGGGLVMPLPDVPGDEERTAARLMEAEFVTANCFCRRKALETLGGFDERFRLAWREDSDLHFRLLALGEIVKAPEALVVHPYRPARWGNSLWRERQVLYDALLYKKHPHLYRQRIQARPAWHYYAVTGFLIGTLAGIWTRAWLWTSLCAAAWIVSTAVFALRRLRATRRTLLHELDMVLTSMLIPPLSVFWRLRGAFRFKVAYF